MSFPRVVASWLLAGLISAPLLAGVIKDPSMGMEGGDLSDPITTNTVFAPTNGGGVFGFFNPLPVPIAAITFETLILPHLTFTDLSAVFSCNDASTKGTSSNPFFLHCGVDYAFDTGLLTISFYGTNPFDGDEDGSDDERGEWEGIPPLAPGCAPPHQDDPGCRDVGHFLITLNDGFSIDPNNPSGGWQNTPGSTLFLPGGPKFTPSQIDTPEPASAVLLGIFLLLVLAAVKRGF